MAAHGDIGPARVSGIAESDMRTQAQRWLDGAETRKLPLECHIRLRGLRFGPQLQTLPAAHGPTQGDARREMRKLVSEEPTRKLPPRRIDLQSMD